MKNLKVKSLSFLLPLMLFSCEIIDGSLFKEEIARGLKSALEVGTDYALRTLGKEQKIRTDISARINDIL